MSNVMKSTNKSPSPGPEQKADTNKKSVKSANIDEGYYMPDRTNKIDYLTVKEKSQASKKEGTVATNDSMMKHLQELDISQESKKFLMTSRYGNTEDPVNLEQFGFEQFILG